MYLEKNSTTSLQPTEGDRNALEASSTGNVTTYLI